MSKKDSNILEINSENIETFQAKYEIEKKEKYQEREGNVSCANAVS